MTLPSLTVAIPSHNRPDLLRRCLETVTRHAPPGTQFLVVDDGSEGAAVSAAARAFAGVEVLRLPKCCGFCVAANAGIAAARGEVVELLNDDTEVAAGWAEAALAKFSDPAVAAVAPLVLFWPDGSRVDSAGDRYYLGGVAGKRGHGEPLAAHHLQARTVFGASGSSAFYRAAAVRMVGKLPEELGAYFEDVDLAFRLNRAGFRAVFEPASRVLHHVSASHGRTGRALLERQSCNEERVFWRNVPARALPAAVPRHLAVLAAKVWRRWCEGTLAPWACGRLRVLTELGALARHRRRVARLGPSANLGGGCVERKFWGTC